MVFIPKDAKRQWNLTRVKIVQDVDANINLGEYGWYDADFLSNLTLVNHIINDQVMLGNIYESQVANLKLEAIGVDEKQKEIEIANGTYNWNHDTIISKDIISNQLIMARRSELLNNNFYKLIDRNYDLWT